MSPSLSCRDHTTHLTVQVRTKTRYLLQNTWCVTDAPKVAGTNSGYLHPTSPLSQHSPFRNDAGSGSEINRIQTPAPDPTAWVLGSSSLPSRPVPALQIQNIQWFRRPIIRCTPIYRNSLADRKNSKYATRDGHSPVTVLLVFLSSSANPTPNRSQRFPTR